MTPKFLLKALALLCLGLILSGCGLGGKKDAAPIYGEADELESLQVPQGLSQPKDGAALSIRGRDVAPLNPDAAEIMPPRVLSSDGVGTSRGILKYGVRGTYLVVPGTVEVVFPRLERSIERTGIEIRKKDTIGQFYEIDYRDDLRVRQKKSFFQRLKFWQRESAEDFSGVYRAQLQADGKSTRIYLFDGDNLPAAEGIADQLLSSFLERMES